MSNNQIGEKPKGVVQMSETTKKLIEVQSHVTEAMNLFGRIDREELCGDTRAMKERVSQLYIEIYSITEKMIQARAEKHFSGSKYQEV